MIRELKIRHRTDNVNKIDSLCPWLERFHWYHGNESIELPGQYNADTAPNLDSHVKIVRFERQINVLHSLRCPIKFTVLCSDGKLYSFLVKYNEDLRQDERIQQMQNIMSDHLKTDKNCSQHKLGLRTFKVIPLNVKCGIISWINDADPIEEFIFKNASGLATIKNDTNKKEYDNFIKAASTNKTSEPLAYVLAIEKYTKKEVKCISARRDVESVKNPYKSFVLQFYFRSLTI